jgi:hypothetical protein
VQKCCSLGSQDDIQVPQEPSEPWAAGHDSARILKLTTTRILTRLDIPWKSWTLYQVLFDLKSSNICASSCLQHVVFGKQGLDHRWSKFPSVAQNVCSSSGGGGGNLCAAVINLWKPFELQLRKLINVPQLLQYPQDTKSHYCFYNTPGPLGLESNMILKWTGKDCTRSAVCAEAMMMMMMMMMMWAGLIISESAKEDPELWRQIWDQVKSSETQLHKHNNKTTTTILLLLLLLLLLVFYTEDHQSCRLFCSRFCSKGQSLILRLN